MIDKEIPEKMYHSTSDVAFYLGVSTTTIIAYVHKMGLHDQLIRRRRGDYVFTYDQVLQMQEFAFTFGEE
jgi:hypothetical protein